MKMGSTIVEYNLAKNGYSKANLAPKTTPGPETANAEGAGEAGRCGDGQARRRATRGGASRCVVARKGRPGGHGEGVPIETMFRKLNSCATLFGNSRSQALHSIVSLYNRKCPTYHYDCMHQRPCTGCRSLVPEGTQLCHVTRVVWSPRKADLAASRRCSRA